MAAAKNSYFDFLGLALLVAVVALVGWRLAPSGAMPLPVGTPLPPLNVEGWLNVPDGETFDPAGQLVVVDCWATWCGPCMQDLPHLITTAADYRPLGVKFVSVTQETDDDLPVIKRVVASHPGFDWPIAYGGTEFVGRLAIRGIPTVVLFGRDGKALWSGIGSYGLKKALDAALTAPSTAADQAPQPET